MPTDIQMARPRTATQMVRPRTATQTAKPKTATQTARPRTVTQMVSPRTGTRTVTLRKLRTAMPRRKTRPPRSGKPMTIRSSPSPSQPRKWLSWPKDQKPPIRRQRRRRRRQRLHKKATPQLVLPLLVKLFSVISSSPSLSLQSILNTCRLSLPMSLAGRTCVHSF